MGNLLVIPSIFAIFAKLIQSDGNLFGLVFSTPRKLFRISDTCSGCVTFLLYLHRKQHIAPPKVLLSNIALRAIDRLAALP